MIHPAILVDVIDALEPRGTATALIAFHRSGREEVSFGELGQRVKHLAVGLRDAGLSPGDRVVLYAPGSLAWITTCLGILRAGGVVVPVDAQLGGNSLEHVVRDCAPRLALTTADRRERLAGAGKDLGKVFLLDGEPSRPDHWTGLLQDGPLSSSPASASPEETAVLFYTSGTTGKPKGVPLTQANLRFQIDTLQRSGLIRSTDRLLLPLPLHHVYPFVVGMLIPLAMGLPLALPAALTGPELIRSIRESGATLVIGVPRLYQALLDGITARATSSGKASAVLFPALLRLSVRLRRHLGIRAGKILFSPLHRRIGPDLRVLASGGAALDPELALRLEGLGWLVGIGYGLTETSPLLTLNPPGSGRTGSVGRPVTGIEIRIAREETNPEQPSSTAAQTGLPCAPLGEVQARGPGVFSGYRDLPDKTREAFTEDGWFRTGDLGCLDQTGWLYLGGRASTLIVTPGGENIQPETVEDALAQSPLLREVAVFQERGRLVALAVPKVGEIRRLGIENLEDAVRDAVRDRSRALPSYQRVTEVLVVGNPLPRTRLGKIRRHLLEGLAREARDRKASAPKPEHMAVEDLPEEDCSLLENPEAAAVWELLTRRFPDRPLALDTSPQYDLGVDSLEWLNLTLEIRERTGVEVDEAAIARIDTVRDLLETVASGQSSSGNGAGDPLVDPERILSPSQMRWLSPRGFFLRVFGWLLHLVITSIMRLFFRVRPVGLDNIPAGEPVILAPNHASYLDPFALGSVLDRAFLERTFWGGWTGAMFTNPFRRFLSRVAQVVPIDPARAAMSSLAFGAAVLKNERNLVWFPEGQRTTTGRLLPFKPGLGMLLDRYPVRVVPVAIHGTFQALPPDRTWPRRVRITVCFGEPLETGRLAREGTGKEPHQRIVSALHDQLLTLLATSAPR